MAKLVFSIWMMVIALGGWWGCETELPTSGQEIWGRNEDELLLIPIGSTLSEIVADPQRPFLYVADFDDNSLHFISSNTRQIVKRLPMGARPSDLHISADGTRLYATLSGGSEIAVVDLESREKLESIPLSFSPAYLASGRSPYFYVTSILEFWKGFNNYGSIATVNARTGAETPLEAVGLLEVDGSRSRLYVATHRKIFKYDIEFGGARLMGEVEAEGPVLEIHLSDDGTRIYTVSTDFFATPELVISHSLLNSRANVEIDYVEVFDTEKMIKVGELYTGAFPRAVACNDKYVAVAASDSRQTSRLSSFVVVYAAQTLEELGTFRLLGTPTHCAALDATADRLYVAVNNPYNLRERFGERQDLQVISMPPQPEPVESVRPVNDGGGAPSEGDGTPLDDPPQAEEEGGDGVADVVGEEDGAGEEGSDSSVPDAEPGIVDIGGGDGSRILWTSVGGVQHEMALFAGGISAMGSEEGDEEQKPVHLVELDPFYMDLHEVTVAQYRPCVDAGVCAEPPSVNLCNWYEDVVDTHPINCMYWEDARAYCEWAGLRLPTEAEWEKAARGVDSRTYPWGEDLDRNKANYGGGAMRTLEVGRHPEGVSPYGIHDMAGNVWEWVQDWYNSHYYSTSPVDDPQGPGSGSHKVLRGGSWHFLPHALRAFHREPYHPLDTDPDIGFRCVRDVD